MSSRSEARAILMRLATLPDREIDLGEAALALAALDRPDRPLAPYRELLATLVTEVAAEPGVIDPTLDERVDALRGVINSRHDFQGDDETYDDPRNANLMWVMDRRRGLPVSIGILYLAIADRLGWNMVGLNFPGHFVVRLEHRGERVILDPFNDGRELPVHALRDMLKATAGVAAELKPTHYQAVGRRDVLLRLQNNVKLRHIANDDVTRALTILERMRMFAPDEASVWRETGLLEAHAGNFTGAITALETFVHLSDSDKLRHQAALLIQELRGRVH